jgi:hypothetical protein
VIGAGGEEIGGCWFFYFFPLGFPSLSFDRCGAFGFVVFVGLSIFPLGFPTTVRVFLRGVGAFIFFSCWKQVLNSLALLQDHAWGSLAI